MVAGGAVQGDVEATRGRAIKVGRGIRPRGREADRGRVQHIFRGNPQMGRIVEELLCAKPQGAQGSYPASSGRRNRIRRVALLRRVAGFLAQGGPRQIPPDAAGPHNETTAQIAKQHAGFQVCVATEAISGRWSRFRSAQPHASRGGRLAAPGLTWGQSCGRQPPRTKGACISGRPGRGGKGFARRRIARATGRLRAASPPGRGRTGGQPGRFTGRSGRSASTWPPPASARYLRPTNIPPASAATPGRRTCAITATSWGGWESACPEGRGPWPTISRGRGVARQRFAALPPSAPAASDLADIDDLAAREALASIRQAAFKAEWAAATSLKAATLVARFDFSGAQKVTGAVGPTAKYYRASSCNFLGLVCANPAAGYVALRGRGNRPRAAGIASWQVAGAVGILH